MYTVCAFVRPNKHLPERRTQRRKCCAMHIFTYTLPVYPITPEVATRPRVARAHHRHTEGASIAYI